MTPSESTGDRDEAVIEREAAEWVLLMHERALGADEEADLAAWRASDPRCERLFASMARTWTDLDGARPGPRAFRPAFVVGPRASRRANGGAAENAGLKARGPGLIAAVALAAAAALALIFFLPQGTPAERHATEIAEVRPLSLPDGSVVTLGADSRIRVRYSENERRVVLESGEAFFDVARDPARPFTVEAGGALVRVVGTKFNVNRARERVTVAVLEGVVQVREDRLLSAAQPARILRAGERIELAGPSALIAPASLSAVAPTVSVPGAWRVGRLDYNDARLGDLVADLNRYYAPGVRLEDPDLAQLPVTASFRADEAARILDVLDHALPIDVAKSATGSFTIRAERCSPACGGAVERSED